jgi:hypothetical protein
VEDLTMYTWTDDDARAYVAFCTALGIADTTVPLRVWANESNNDPAAHNPSGDASGLFQLMPSTAKGLGWDTDADPRLAAYRALSVADQLSWAARYYADMRAHLGTVRELYCVTFLPAMAHLAVDPNAVLCGLHGPFAWAYTANPGFDAAKKGSITGADLEAAANRAYGPRAQAIAAQVARLVDTQPEIASLADLATEATTGLLDGGAPTT